MSDRVLVAWTAWLVWVAFATRPSVPRPASEPVEPGAPVGGTGRGVPPMTVHTRRVAVGVAGLGLGVVAAWSPVLAGALGVLGAGGRWFVARRAARRRASETDRQLVLLMQVLDLAVGAGATLRSALPLAAPHLRGELGAATARAVRRLELGMGLADALDELARELHGRDRGVLKRVSTAETIGSPVSSVLRRASAELAHAERQRAALRARRLPVLMLLPLVACVLPAFVVLAIVPMVVSGAGSFFPS